jgi:hypothetical protein
MSDKPREPYVKPELYSMNMDDTHILDMSELLPTSCIGCNDECQYCRIIVL